MNRSLIDVFRTVRFLADASYMVNLYVPPFQQPNRLPVAWIPKGASAFCLRVKFVFGDNVAIRFNPSGLP
jgi:hypothetical protein